MNIIDQRKYNNLYLGSSGLSVAKYGCYSACLAMFYGLTMEELVDIFNKKGVYNSSGLIKHPNDTEALGADEYYSTQNTPSFPCIAEVDFNPDPDKDQHFVVWLGDGRIIDPWGGELSKKIIIKFILIEFINQ